MEVVKNYSKGIKNVNIEYNLSLDEYEFLNYFRTNSVKLVETGQIDFKINKEVVSALKTSADAGCVITIMTNNQPALTDSIMKCIGISELITEVVCTERNDKGINRKLPYLIEVISKYGIENNEILFFDDKQHNLDAASELGIRTVGVAGEASDPTRADWLIYT